MALRFARLHLQKIFYLMIFQIALPEAMPDRMAQKLLSAGFSDRMPEICSEVYAITVFHEDMPD